MPRRVAGVFVLGALTACGASAVTPPSVATAPPSLAPQIACGDFHSCLLAADGTVTCWGRNAEGELGDGTTVNRSTPTAVVGVAHATQLALAHHASCALLQDGTVTCWGGGNAWNDGKPRDGVAPTPVLGIRDAVAIDAGGLLICAVLRSGAVSCWGDDATLAASKARPPTAGAKSVTVAEAHACALMQDGTVRCWGDGDWGGVGDKAYSAPAVRGVTAVTSGDFLACAHDAAQKTWCWGGNEQGELAKPADMEPHVAPVEIPQVAGAKTVVAGESHLCAVMPDATARCWGSNGDGELGRGTQGEPQLPGPLGALSSVAEIALGADHGCARLDDASVYCWGANTQGQLGDGTLLSKTSPVKVAF